MITAPQLASLNPQQRQAAVHGVVEGAPPTEPLLVIAGAGSGKTSTLAHRVAHLVLNGADPDRILLVTFSRRAATELGRRVDRIVAAALGASQIPERRSIAWSGTFHAIGARLLRRYAAAIGLVPTFTINDREDSADLMNLVRHELGLSAKGTRFPLKATCLAIYSRTVNTGARLEEVVARHFPWCNGWHEELRRLFENYVTTKQAQGVLDYDDLLLYWAEMMSAPELAAEIGRQFDHVLVDEYQDTNPLQATILRRMKPDGRGVCVVGDDAQSIYGFRAACVRNILDFPGQFDPPAAIVTLEQNYRSTQAILTASNKVIELAAERFTKNLFSERAGGEKPSLVTVLDERAQALFVVERVLDARERGVPLKAQAVLFRTAHHSGSLEIELTRRNIPFVKFGGLKFLEAAHIKDLIAVLRWGENSQDRMAGFRVLQLLPGIGPAIAGRLLERIGTSNARSDILGQIRAPAAAAEAWPQLATLISTLDDGRAGWPDELDAVRQWYEPRLVERYDDAVVRTGDLDQLQRIAAGYPSRERFLTELALDPPDATSDESGRPMRDEDYLILSTIHSAKGQEWKAVYVLNVVDGCMPSDLGAGSRDELEEERRLLYVAMTRAKDELHLVLPQRFYTHQQARGGDRHVYAGRSRFIPSAVLRAFSQTSWPVRARDEAARPGESDVPSLDVAARMRGMWRAAVP